MNQVVPFDKKDPRHLEYLKLAIKEAELAYAKGEVPVGVIIVKDEKIIAKAHNSKELTASSIGHAEINAIKEAERYLEDWRLNDCVMYSTLEPCPMCAGAILHSRIRSCIYAAKDHKWGAHTSKLNLFKKGVFNHNTEMIFLEQIESEVLLRSFFKKLRVK